MPLRRRDFGVLVGAALFTWGVPRLYRGFGQTFDFRPIAGLEGFRRLDGTGLSGADFLLVGLETPDPRDIALQEMIRRAPCAAAFRTPAGPGEVPVALFSDYFCPTCPSASRDLDALIDAGAPVRLTWHDLPVFGPRSEAVARAAIAAELQGAEAPVRAHLMTSILRPGDAALRDLAERFGLDPGRFVADTRSARADARLEESAALAAVLGVAGTPSMLVGRSLVVGRLPRSRLADLIDLEADAGALPASCA